MKLSNVRPFLLSACFLLAVALVATLLSGCDGNHIIGDLPTCVELVTDECVPEIVEEFCEPVEECDVDVVETDADTCDLSVPVGHRPIECRGKGHSSLKCDKNCGEFDPICIPCDLQVGRRA